MTVSKLVCGKIKISGYETEPKSSHYCVPPSFCRSTVSHVQDGTIIAGFISCIYWYRILTISGMVIAGILALVVLKKAKDKLMAFIFKP
mmetsp:Transcript_25711/g.39536  ORF Transcript_25711/g.39536 Transcript_25711/m.39536 type:complete len:89 (+) Transcript_25711:468-734(+)